ncbi:peptide chain release factor 1 [Consotaella salsifontis]|uniref:Peptide chain release factor 1 n=1 Tax=Consotaella salsifontis TaxID=1365950 RepID=A0A1T4QLC1_9HYPH|nr:peptide chain release factor 1 [Consotaella salsifontis]SKA04476.1 bacterial peptide chain release factor 1 (bRF-1) [Consotaella salsifontis]
MVTLPEDSMNEMVKRFAYLEAEMAKGGDRADFGALAADYASLEPVVKAIQTYRAAEREVADLRTLRDDPSGDREMRQLAEVELHEVEDRLEKLAGEVQILLLPKDDADEKGAILEIRAGTGGSEAALFAGDLFRMYNRFAELSGWKVEILSASEGDVGGYKEVIASVKGKNVFSRLKFESGVHRVQRVPETESGGRIHTSAATVAVLPEAADIDVDIKAEDIRIDTMRSSGAGGQHVNTTDSAVRITHLPTGIVVTSSEKSQHQNRARAMEVLKARLYDLERHRADSARSEARRVQVGSGDRSERIRTYNFPQGRVTDHRINLTLYKLDRFIEGEMDELIDALIAEDQAARLAAVKAEA